MREIPVRDPPAGEWPAGELESPGCCPVCGGSMRERLHDDARDRIFFCAPGRWTLWRCAECRSAYLDPRPAASAIGRAYRGYYTHEKVPSGSPGGPWCFLQQAVINDWLRAHYRVRRHPWLPLGRFLLVFLPRYHRSVGQWARHLPRPGPDSVCLDIGCGRGDFFEVAQACGWRVQGLEPDPVAAGIARGRGVRVHTGGLPATGLEPDAYEAVTLNHVLEHVHDPGRAVREVWRLLRPGGILWIATPNLGALGYRRFGVHWRGLEPPRHLVLFHPASLTDLLRRAGFDPVVGMPASLKPLRNFASSHRIASGQDPNDEAIPVPWRIRLAAFIAALGAWLRPAWGEELIFIAQKPRLDPNQKETGPGDIQAEGHEESRTQPGEEPDRVSCARTEPAEDETERD